MAPASTLQQVRGLKTKTKGKGKPAPSSKTRKLSTEYIQRDLKDMPQWALCDAMRYVLNAESYAPAHQLTV